MSQTEPDANPLADSRIRALIGLSGGAIIAVLDVLVTPYLLGRAVESDPGAAAT